MTDRPEPVQEPAGETSHGPSREASAGSSREPSRQDEPRYGMRLPAGARIEDYIVPKPQRRARQLAAGHQEQHAPQGQQPYPPQQAPGGAWHQPPQQHSPGPQHTHQFPQPPVDGYGAGAQPGAPYRPDHHPQQGRPQQYPPQQHGHAPSPYGYQGYHPQQPPYPSAPPLHPEQQREEEQRRKRRTRALITALISGAVMILAPLTGMIIAAVVSIGPAFGDLASARQVINGSAVSLAENTDLAIMVNPMRELTGCTVTDPHGGSVPVTVVDERITRESTMAVPGARFSTTAAGEYTISCSDVDQGATLAVGAPVVLKNTGRAGLAGTGGFLLGALALSVLVYSLITLRRTRRPRP